MKLSEIKWNDKKHFENVTLTAKNSEMTWTRHRGKRM